MAVIHMQEVGCMNSGSLNARVRTGHGRTTMHTRQACQWTELIDLSSLDTSRLPICGAASRTLLHEHTAWHDRIGRHNCVNQW